MKADISLATYTGHFNLLTTGTAIVAGAAWVDPRHASRAGQLMALHDFNEELNSVIGLNTLQPSFGLCLGMLGVRQHGRSRGAEAAQID